MEDITREAISANKLRESEARYYNLIISSPFAIGILKGENLVITTANNAIVEIWGKGWGIIGKAYFEALPELVEQGYKEVFAHVYKTGQPFNAVETPVNILQNGKMEMKYYNFLLYAQRDTNGETEGIGIIATEVTTQALFNKQLKENEKQFRLLADSMPQHIWTSDPEGNLNYFNQSVFDYSGLTPEQINKDGWLQIVHPDERELNSKEWMHSIKTGKDFKLEHRFRKHTGEYRWQLSRAVPQKDENGNIQMWVGTSTDIQDQKTFSRELERQVSERTSQLEQKNRELEKMNIELQSFNYVSSHDLQEPLRKIQTFASRLLEKEYQNLSENGKNYFNRMRESAKTMQRLIQDLLTYSRTNSSERIFEETNLNEILAAIKNDLAEVTAEKNAIIDADELCTVRIIPFQFKQLLNNLISNSIKFSRPGVQPIIKIRTEIMEGFQLKNDLLVPDIMYCHMTISDNGIGFEPEYKDRIFELFQRLHPKDDYAGTGIGLSIVKKIVENHNGFIKATSEKNEGATFDIYLPV